MWVFCYSQGPLYTFSDLTFVTAVWSPSLPSPCQEEGRRGAKHASWIVIVTSQNFIYIQTISCNSFKSTLMWGLLVCLYIFTRETRPAFKERTRTRAPLPFGLLDPNVLLFPPHPSCGGCLLSRHHSLCLQKGLCFGPAPRGPGQLGRHIWPI